MIRRAFARLLVATQFLTRLPVPVQTDRERDALAESAIFFPLVGLLVGTGAVLLHRLLAPHAGRDAVAVLMLVYLVLITGGFHEDGLADAADGFGGGMDKESMLAIMRDSRIGSFGAIALALSFLARFVFLIHVPERWLDGYLIAAQVLCRWTSLPLGYFLPPARPGSGLGMQVSGRLGGFELAIGSVLAAGIVGAALRTAAFWVLAVAVGVTLLTGLYYRSQIQGVTGDCLGATNQVTEAAVYLTGVMLG